VPRAYNIFRAYEGMKGRKNTNNEMKKENIIQNKIQDFKIFEKKNSTISLPVKYEVCEKSTFHSLCLANGVVGV
jgi:hypothetical protein